MQRLFLWVTIITFLLTGCKPTLPEGTSLPTLLPTGALDTATRPIPTLAASPSATPTLPTATTVITTSPTATLAATPAPHPMSILAMRADNYPGSDIVIVNELDPGANYRRFYAYYLSEGLKIYALLTVPDGAMPAGGWPAIVFNHGYIPPQIYRTTERYIGHVDSLARYGYIVFRIDYRGNDRSEGVATGAYSSPGYTVDVLNAVASIRRFPLANPQKIGMWGHSMGGFLTLRAMVISHDIKAGVIWSGVVAPFTDIVYNWEHHHGPTPTPPPAEPDPFGDWIRQYGTPEQNPPFWDSISANSYLADLSGPLQLHHGTADEEVPLVFSQDLADAIKAINGRVEFYTYKDANHNLEQVFSTAMYRTIQFFDLYLK